MNDHDILNQFGGLVANSLIHKLTPESGSNEDDEHSINAEPQLINLSPYFSLEKLTETLRSKQNQFTVLSLNCASLNAKYDQIKILIEELEHKNCIFSAICIQETWQSATDDMSIYQINGYNLISQGYICSSHGGLAIYLRNSFNYKTLPVYKESEIWEGQFIEISSNLVQKKIVLGNIYRPPRDVIENYNSFTNELTDLLNTLNNRSCEVLLAGDFNIDLLRINEKEVVNTYFDAITSLSYFPQITLPTRLSEHRGTLIDNFILKLSNFNRSPLSGVLTLNISDHFPYFISLDYIKVYKPSPKYIRIRTKNPSSQTEFLQEINASNLYDKLDKNPHADPTANYNMMERICKQALNKHFPSKIVKFNKHKHKKSRWITQGIVISINHRDRLYRELKKTPVESAEYNLRKTNLQTYNNILKNNIKEAKKLYYNLCFNRYKGDIKNTWKSIKEVLNKSKNNASLPDFFKVDGKIVTDKQTIANDLNSYFAEVGSNLAAQVNPTENNEFQDYLQNPCMQTFTFKPITADSVNKIIDSLKPKTSCGHDGISVKLVKDMKHEISNALTLIINQSITTGIFPENMKIAKVTPLFKKGDVHMFENYRLISLLPSFSKIIEKVLFNHLNEYFKSNQLFYNHQYGFRELHSTELATLEFVDRILNIMDKGDVPLSIFMDLSKAFDTLNHKILIHKLSYYGVTGMALNLLNNYLTNRKQYVEFEEFKSTLANIQTGVPQGSILGPLLFIIYINDLSTVSDLFDPIMYADDTTLISSLLNIQRANITQNVNLNINKELNKISKWMRLNKLSLNENKTKFMIFHYPQKRVLIPEMEINNTVIECVENFNFLGIVIDKHLSWKDHIDKIASKLSQTTGVMNRIKEFLPTHILQTIYNSLVLPHLNYGILLWGHKSIRISQLQKRSVRIVSHSKFIAHTDPIFKNLKLLKLKDIYLLQQLKFYFNFVNNRLPDYFNQFQIRTASEIHTYNTRNKLKMFRDRTDLVNTRKCIRHEIIETLNNTPDIVLNKVHTHSRTGFVYYAKQYFINKYTVTCTIANCYVCNAP
mgnify:CR=1 FL=1